MGFHAEIDTDQQKIEVETEPQSVGGCELLVKTVPGEVTTRLGSIIFYSPYISHIDKSGQLKKGGQFSAILQAHVELDVSRLVGKIIAQAIVVIGAGTVSGITLTFGPTTVIPLSKGSTMEFP